MSDDRLEPKSIEERLASLESRMLQVEMLVNGRSHGQPGQGPDERTSADAIKPPAATCPITVTMNSKRYHQADFRGGDVANRIDFVFVFASSLKKDARAFKGAVLIKDLFGQDIIRVTLTHETGLRAGGSVEWQGGIKYNKFLSNHQRLMTVQQTDLTISFELESVIYTDGTRESF
ncbi:MAG TPA: hypothetical protein VI756_15010 [Blastocatellia bacterium]